MPKKKDTKGQSERHAAIVAAAFSAFSQYGFKRTSMDDIAEIAQVPRTALYRIFRNKDHIFQVLAERVHTDALNAAALELSSPGSLPTRIEKALIARDRLLLQVGHTGPHADEIAELYESLATEIASNHNKQFVALLEQEVNAAKKRGEFGLPKGYQSVRDFCILLRLSLEGIKREFKAVKDFERLAKQVIRGVFR